MAKATQVCPKCGSTNVQMSVQQETQTISKTKSKYKEKGHGCLWWLLIGSWWWVFDLVLWIFLFIPRALLHLGRKKKYVQDSTTVTTDKVNYVTVCICQDCGHNWKA